MGSHADSNHQWGVTLGWLEQSLGQSFFDVVRCNARSITNLGKPSGCPGKRSTDLGGKKGRWHVTKTMDHELFMVKVLVHEPIEGNPSTAS